MRAHVVGLLVNWHDIGVDSDVLKRLRGQRVFASCSSGDKEFRSLLLCIDATGRQGQNPLSDLRTSDGLGSSLVVAGGFPANFDGHCENEKAQDIDLTRCLLYGAIVQLLAAAQQRCLKDAGRYQLSPQIQSFVAQEWLACRESRHHGNAHWPDFSWVRERSDGTHVEVHELAGLRWS